MLIPFMKMLDKPTPNSVLGSSSQVPMLNFSLVTFDGSSRIETRPNSRHILEQTSFCKLARAIDVVGHGCVGRLVQVAAWGGLGLATPTFTPGDKADLRDFGYFVVRVVGSLCGIAWSVTALRLSFALALYSLVKFETG